MKKLQFILLFCAALLLPACGAKDPMKLADHSGTFRIVDGAESGDLVLADETDVYTLHVSEDLGLRDGMLVEIGYDSVMESWPAQLADISGISVVEGAYRDHCGLYLQVMDDLWQTDDGLNGGAEYISVDLREAPGALTQGEIAAISWIFSGKHQAEPLTLSYEELAEQGYLTEVGTDLYEWENGLLFRITARGDKFSAEKWRTPLGAYFFEDCTVKWDRDGAFQSYTIGAEAIS